MVTLAGEAGVPITPWGGGTAVGVGSPPTRVGIVLALRRLDRSSSTSPAISPSPPRRASRSTGCRPSWASAGQWLSLDPADAERATLGGILAATPRARGAHLYGTARDLVIGLTVVSADGRAVRGGGKVVKNVAGYDLPKLFIGSLRHARRSSWRPRSSSARAPDVDGWSSRASTA